jgi:hypothetical protein
MPKAIYNKDNGTIYSYAYDQQNIDALLGNYENVDWIPVYEFPQKQLDGQTPRWHVDPTTKELIKTA